MKLIPKNIIDSFIKEFDVQPGYAIKAQGTDGLLDHWFIYLGHCTFPEADGVLTPQHVFAAQMSPQLQFIGEARMRELMQKYFPVEVRKCYEGECDPCTTANNAIQKVRINQEKLNLIFNNCQDFVRHSTIGEAGSYQRMNLWYFSLFAIVTIIVIFIISSTRK